MERNIKSLATPAPGSGPRGSLVMGLRERAGMAEISACRGGRGRLLRFRDSNFHAKNALRETSGVAMQTKTQQLIGYMRAGGRAHARSRATTFRIARPPSRHDPSRVRVPGIP
jgi:hypothetical protein